MPEDLLYTLDVRIVPECNTIDLDVDRLANLPAFNENADQAAEENHLVGLIVEEIERDDQLGNHVA